MPKEKNRFLNAGFTLIELLVVVVIISILAIFLFVAFTQVQKNARDTQRKNDLQTVAAALQRFYSDNSTYPNHFYAPGASQAIIYKPVYCRDTTANFLGVGGGNFTGWGTGKISCSTSYNVTPKTSYLKQVPKDPLGQTQYCYQETSPQPTNDGTNITRPLNILYHNFNLYAKMENASNANTSGVSCGDATGYNYQVTASD